MKINNIVIICLLMFSFFLTVAGRNLASSPPSPNINLDAPPVQRTLPPPSPIGNIGGVSIAMKSFKKNMVDLLIMLVITFILMVVKACLGIVQTSRERRS
jgi:hypothetical protein